jgi:hypothetical protein
MQQAFVNAKNKYIYAIYRLSVGTNGFVCNKLYPDLNQSIIVIILNLKNNIDNLPIT